MGQAGMASMSMGGDILGKVMGAVGSIMGGQSQASADKYNAAMAHENAHVLRENANIAGQAGAEQAQVAGLKSRAIIGDTVAAQGASNVNVHSGSAVDVRTSEQEVGQLDAMNIRGNAAKVAYGYKVQAIDKDAEAALDTADASNALTSGWINAGTTLLGGTADASSEYMKFQQAGAFG